MNQYRCETCEHRFTPDYWKDGCNRFGKTFVSDDEMRFIFTYGCVSHSSFKCAQDQIKLGDRRTCEYQEIKTYPSDEFIYCKSLEKCEFQCPESIGEAIFCDKPVITHDAVIERSARKDERDKVLDELEKWTNLHLGTIYSWELRDYIKELRQAGEPDA